MSFYDWMLALHLLSAFAAASAHVHALLESHLREGGMVVLSTHHDMAISARSIQRLELGQ